MAALLVVACAVAARRRPAAVAPVADAPPLAWRRRLSWLALAAVPSSLMLGVTTYATRDLTPFPLLWVLPLAVYLLTFVIAFAPRARPERLVRWSRIALPGIAIVVVYTLAIGSERPLWLLLPLHVLGLGAAALMCHSRLAVDRPPTANLTEFYVWVGLGGVLGGGDTVQLVQLLLHPRRAGRAGHSADRQFYRLLCSHLNRSSEMIGDRPHQLRSAFRRRGNPARR